MNEENDPFEGMGYIIQERSWIDRVVALRSQDERTVRRTMRLLRKEGVCSIGNARENARKRGMDGEATETRKGLFFSMFLRVGCVGRLRNGWGRGVPNGTVLESLKH